MIGCGIALSDIRFLRLRVRQILYSRFKAVLVQLILFTFFLMSSLDELVRCSILFSSVLPCLPLSPAFHTVAFYHVAVSLHKHWVSPALPDKKKFFNISHSLKVSGIQFSHSIFCNSRVIMIRSHKAQYNTRTYHKVP